ncbi:MAG: hypothetical protein QM784_05315 [Polyangiaceae bacterium]
MRRIFAFVSSLIGVMLLTSVAFAQSDMVKLIRAENYYVAGYNNGGYTERNVLIQVKNVAYDKQVHVHAERSDGVWVDVPAHFERMGNDTYELWRTRREDFDGNYGYRQYALKYQVSGQTYWDNNGGANYAFQSDYANGPGPRLGNDINVLLYSASHSGNFYAYVDVRNIAYTKNVAIIYTANHWATSTTLDASFVGWYQTGYSSFIQFPNVYGVERWRVNAPVSASQFEFYLAYTVNGSTYYDNNYGANYSIGY